MSKYNWTKTGGKDYLMLPDKKRFEISGTERSGYTLYFDSGMSGIQFSRFETTTKAKDHAERWLESISNMVVDSKR